jgi:hypothetical protein
MARYCAILFGICAVAGRGMGGEVTLTRTNLTERWITNVIEVRMPVNRFVDEYHTNWITELRTNVLDVFVTNRLTRTVTNQVVVDSYRTNLTTFRLTNWETVVVIKTNWITQSLTNVVQVDLTRNAFVSAEAGAAKQAVKPSEVRPDSTPAPAHSSTNPKGPLVLEASRTSQPAANNLAEVLLKVNWVRDAAAPLRVQQWKVESEDGAVFCFGQEREFKRELPFGRYNVEVKVQPDGHGPLLAARGTLAVTSDEAVLQSKLTAQR